MSRHSQYLQDVRREARKIVETQLATLCQIGLDSAAIAANEVLHMGPTKAEEFSVAYLNAHSEIILQINADTADLEYAWTLLDRRLKPIYGDKFQPHEIRYGDFRRPRV